MGPQQERVWVMLQTNQKVIFEVQYGGIFKLPERPLRVQWPTTTTTGLVAGLVAAVAAKMSGSVERK